MAMSNVNVTVSPETLRDYSARFQNHAQVLNDTFTQLLTDARNLNGEWKGPASDAFLAELEDRVNFFNQTVSDTQKMSQQAYQAAEVYDSNEATMASKFHG